MSDASLVVRTVDTAEGFAELASGWDELVVSSPRPSPFLLHGWLCAWWQHYGDGATLAVVTAHRDGRLVGALPLYVKRRGLLRVARFMGAHESALADLLLAPDEANETGRALVEAARGQAFDLVDLFGLPSGSRLAGLVDGAELDVFERVEAPVLLMPDGWETAYAAKTSSKKRNLHRRRLRQLGEAGEVEWRVSRTLEELGPALEDAFALHGLRWEGRPDGSTFGTAEGHRFHRDAIAAIAPAGVPVIVTLLVGGRPIAFHYFFALADTMYVHRLAFDPDPSLARFSPGAVCTLETIRVASELGLTRVEFLGGDERYKLELADRLEPLCQAIGLSHGPLATLAVRQRVGIIRARRKLKHSPLARRVYVDGLAPLRRLRRRDAAAADR
jgi:CelD/BcsL family acetyltransferase involved in cellulose biosynthesis